MLTTYLEHAQAQTNVSFVGRLGTYRYLDMDVTIGEALTASDRILECVADNTPIPAFFIDPT